jgi:hypothetical protein
MTYGNPSIPAAIQRLAEQNVKRLLVLPLYPQYCSSTTGSVFDRTTAALSRWRWLPETRFVNDYHLDAGYIDAMTNQILRHWSAAGERSHLVLSYHGIPAAYVAEGDPYQSQTEATTRAITLRLQLSAGEYSQCYQSRFGKVVWLQPYTTDLLADLVRRGVRNITVASPVIRRRLSGNARGSRDRIPAPIHRAGRREIRLRAVPQRFRSTCRGVGGHHPRPAKRLVLTSAGRRRGSVLARRSAPLGGQGRGRLLRPPSPRC